MSLARAISLAAEIHETQYDKGGQPYILHPLRVMEDAMRVERDRFVTDQAWHEVGIVAVLHDVLEDNKKYGHRQLEEMIEKEFGYPVLRLVKLLTKGVRQDYLNEYISGIIGNGGYPITIKMADLRDNMNILRQPSLDDKALLRIQKYHMAYRMLREKRT